MLYMQLNLFIMEGLHERFLVSVRSGNNDREFEVVPNLSHYAILENDETVAEIEFNETWKQISGNPLPKEILASLVEKINKHEA